MKTYTIKEIKEQGIWVKTDGNHQANILKRALEVTGNVTTGGIFYYKYSIGSYNNYINERNINQPFIEFSQIDFEEFTLPEIWYTVITNENYNTLNKWFKANASTDTIDLYGYKIGLLSIVGKYKQNNIITVGMSSKPTGNNWTFGNEITFEQFKKYVLKTEEKEIVGYKCPISLYAGNCPIGTIYIKPIIGQTPAKWYHPKTSAESDFKVPSEIVETWEPVYKEEELKIGNYPIEFKKSSIKVNNQEFDREELGFMVEHLNKKIDNQIFISGIAVDPSLLKEILTKLKNG